jgi:hypothetical protein
LDVVQVRSALIPRLEESDRQAFGMRAFAAARMRHQAVQKEREARALVERWIAQQGNA